ncbi:winged helix-turn-helix domain-containing protein [Escherichia coli]
MDVQITRLRKKLEDDASNPIWLKTIRGNGYCLTAN